MRGWLARHFWFPLQELLKGHETLTILREMERVDSLSAAELASLQRERLQQFVEACYRDVPYVRRRMQEHAVNARDVREPADLRRLPLMTKADVRADRQALRSQTARRLAPFTTGGSTGEPLVFDLGKRRVASRVACRQRVAGWFGLRPGDPEVAIWGSSIEVNRQDWIRGIRDWLLNTTLLSAFDMTDSRMSHYLDVIERRRPRQLFGYPSAVHLLCLRARKDGRALRTLGLKAVFVTGEVLFPHQRELISDTFGCLVANGYGGRDSGFISHECPEGGLHVLSDAIIVEILDSDGRPVPDGSPGEIVVTDLYSEEAPFIRYATGDIGVASKRTCACGRALPLLEHIEGRSNDLVVAFDGRLINSLALVYALRELPGIEQYRIVQKRIDSFCVQMACNDEYAPESEERIRAKWAQLLRIPVAVTFEYLPRIPPDPRGKFRHVVSELAPTGKQTRDALSA